MYYIHIYIIVLIIIALCREVSLLPWLQAQAFTEKLVANSHDSLNGPPMIQYTYYVYINMPSPPLQKCTLRCAIKLWQIESNV